MNSWKLIAPLCMLGAVAGRVDAEGPVGGVEVRRIKVVADKAPDSSSLRSIVEGITRGCRTNDEKAIAIYNYMQLTHYHQAYPDEAGGLGALREINVYGWSLCGGLHTVEAALWRELGWPWRYVGWSNPGHTTVEAQYDGRWHYLDAFLKFYAWMPDPNAPGGRTIAGQDDLKANPALITEGFEFDKARGVYYRKGDRFEVVDGKANWRAPSFLCCGDQPEDILLGLRSGRSRDGSPTGWAGITFDSPGYSTDVDLASGGSLTLTWDAAEGAHWWNGRQAVPGHGCVDKDSRNCPAIGPILEPYHASGGQKRSFSSGTLEVSPGLADSASLKLLAAVDNAKLAGGKVVPADPGRPASITVSMRSPYVMTKASGRAEGVDSAEVSVDGGKTYAPIWLADFSEQVGGKYACLVRLSTRTALAAPRLSAVVQCNRGALPYLSPGRNRITVSVDDPAALADDRLVVTYAYREGARSGTYESLADADAEVARAHQASWSETPTVVQKVFQAKDLPASFEVDIPTPRGKQPAYPRMLFLRREVLAAGARPLPLPDGAQGPAPRPGVELKSMANPYSVGTEPPPSKAERATERRTIALRPGPALSTEGKAEEGHFLKWKPGETWVLPLTGSLGTLPPARDIAGARLVIPVSGGHPQASTLVGVTLPTAPFLDGKRFDFKDLGEVVGTVVVPLRPTEAGYDPPRPFAVDVTRAIRGLSTAKGPFRGFAIRVVPDRPTDEGYITRLDLPKVPRIVLELDVYREGAVPAP